MSAVWMIYALALGLLLGLAAHALERVASLWWWPRRFVWTVAILASLLVPLAVLMRPPAPPSRAPAPRMEPPGNAVASVAPVRGMPSGAGTVALSKVSALLATVNRPLLLLWCATSLVLVFRLLRSGIGLRRRARGWRAVVVDGTPVLVAPDIGPAVVRLGRLKIVLPDWALSAEPLARSLMLQHEKEHCRARDPDLLLGATVALVLAPWNLPLWWQVHRLQLAVETDCDRRVMRAGAEAQAYGGLLVRVGARRTRQPLLAATAFAETPSLLERRILAMTTPRPKNPIVRAALATCVAALGVAAACMTPHPAPAPAQQPAAAPAPQTAPAPTQPAAVPMQQPGPTQAPRELPAGVYREADVTERPERIGGPAPRYPDLLRAAGVEGRVLVEFIVDTTGRVDPGSVRILSSTRPEFEAPTREAIVASTFRPGLLQGRAVPVLVSQPVNFAVMRGPDFAFTPPASDTLFRDAVKALRDTNFARADTLLGLVQQRATGQELQAATFYLGMAEFQRAFAAFKDAELKRRDVEKDPAVKAAACASVTAAGDFLNRAEPNIRGSGASNRETADQLLNTLTGMRNSLPQLARALNCPS